MASANNTRISLARLATFLAKCKDTFALKSALNNKQDKLKWDSTPTLNSANPVTSDGIMKALNKKQNSGNYQTKLTFDTKPTANSSNPVTSGGVLSAINNAMASSGAQFYKKPKMTYLYGVDFDDPDSWYNAATNIVQAKQSKYLLKQPWNEFDAICFVIADDDVNIIFEQIWPTWEIEFNMRMGQKMISKYNANAISTWWACFSITRGGSFYWWLRGAEKPTVKKDANGKVLTTTLKNGETAPQLDFPALDYTAFYGIGWGGREEKSDIVSIYGLKWE